MKCEFLKIETIDGLKLPTLYHKKRGSKTLVIHVHGMAGSFFEDYVFELAKAYNDVGYSFVCFNNRGSGYYTSFLKNDKIMIYGSNYELFSESKLDIDAVVRYFEDLGYENVILSSHSYGCNKVVNYYVQTKDKKIKKLVLMSPCDVIMQTISKLGNKYESLCKKAKEMVNTGFKNEVLSFSFYPLCFSCNTFLNDFIEGGKNDIFRYRTPGYVSDELKSIKIMVDVIIGDNDKVVYLNDKRIVLNYIKENIKNVSVVSVKDCGHTYKNKQNLYDTIKRCNNLINFNNNSVDI